MRWSGDQGVTRVGQVWALLGLGPEPDGLLYQHVAPHDAVGRIIASVASNQYRDQKQKLCRANMGNSFLAICDICQRSHR